MAHLVGGRWVESSDQISITPTGAQATNAQFSVAFLGNANSANALNVTLPEGRILTSGVLGLAYWDTATDNSVFFALIKDSNGQLLPSGHEALFQDCFTGTLADLLYVTSVSGLDQMVILREQLPSPALWGMSPESTMVQVITEWSTNGPAPRVIPTQTLGGRDDHLDWGVMQMPQGYAFAVGSETNKVPVTKFWLTTPDFRTCLVEQVPFEAILPSIQTLPPRPSGASLQPAPGSAPQLASRGLVLPPPKATRMDAPSLKLAKTTPERKGYAMDFTLTLTSSQTNFVFQSDTTYFITNNASVLLCGSNVFEGGTVIKYGTNASIQIYPSATTPAVSFYGSPYRPIYFSSMDDSSAGDQIRTNAPSGYYASPALHLAGLSQIPNLAYVRFAFAQQAISLGGVSANILDAQFINCQQGVYAGGSVIHFRNVLFANTLTNVVNQGDVNATAENCTFNGSGYLVTSPAGSTGSSFSMTNSIVANISHILFIGVLDATNGDYNGFYSSPGSFGTHIAPTPFGSPFQTVGAGNFYLAMTNYRSAGTASIDTNLLAELTRKTTWPPIVLYATNINSALNLSPQAPRDTNSAPDLGYHYEPLDYAFGGARVSGPVGVSVSPGTVIAAFDRTTNSFAYGLAISSGAQVLSLGSPASLARFVTYNTAQEQSLSTWAVPTNNSILIDYLGAAAGTSSFRFTDFSSLAQNIFHMYMITAPVNVQDCQFHGGFLVANPSLMNLTNCLFERVWSDLEPSSGIPVIRNNTFFGGEFDFNPTVTNATVYDNLFDHTVFGYNLTGHGYNGGFNVYITNTAQLLPTNATDVVVPASPAYQTGPLGKFYLPSNSTLINGDTSTTADRVGLFHYTVTTNIVNGWEIKETNSSLDIGYHSVVVDTNGIPVSSSCSGIPDYLADANGDGLTQASENPWNLSISSQPQSTNVVQGQDAIFSVVACGTKPFAYQWCFNGAVISGATASSYTRVAVSPLDAGSYSVVVTNPFASLTSSIATLAVTVPLSIAPANQPTNLTVFQGVTTNFYVLADGSNPAYQWWTNSVALVNSSHIGGATKGTLTITNVVGSDATGYNATATNLAGSVTSSVATLSVILPPSITSGPQSCTNVQTTDANFTVTAAGIGLGYQWQFNGTNISGATSNSYTRFVVQAADAGTYTVVVTNAVGTNTASATLTVVVPPIITIQPSNVTTNYGSNAVFTVTLLSSDTTPLTNQWYFDSTNALPSQTNLSLTVTATNPGGYSLALTNIAGTNLSATAWLSVIFSGGTTNGWWSNGAPVTVPSVVMIAPTNTSPTNPAIYPFGPPISIRATATDTNGYVITNVVFYSGTTNATNFLGTAVAGANTTYGLAWTNAPLGTNWLWAVAKDNNGASNVSPRVYVIMDNPPVVWAGTNQTVLWTEGSAGTNLNLSGGVADDGYPYGILTNQWTVLSANSNNVIFNSATSAVTTATFTANGIFTLKLTAYDGFTSSSSNCTITIKRGPFVSLIAPTNNATLLQGDIGLHAIAYPRDAWAAITNVEFRDFGTNHLGTALQSIRTTFAMRWSTNQPLLTNVLTAIATDSDGLSCTSTQVTVLVVPPLYVWIKSPANGSIFPASPTNVLLWANPTSYAGGSITSMNFSNGSTYLGPGVPQGDGTYQFWWQNVSNGTFTVIAQASDSLLNVATNAVTFTNYPLPTVVITSPTNNAHFREPANVSVSGYFIDTNCLSRHIQIFYTNGSVGNATITGTNFSFTLSNLLTGPFPSVGAYPVSAMLTNTNGISVFSPIKVFYVDPTNQPPDVAITFPTTNMLFPAGADVIISAVATAHSGALLTNVEFYANGNPLGACSTNPYSLKVCCWAPGNYALVAKATDSFGACGVSMPILITVAIREPSPGNGFWDPTFGNPGASIYAKAGTALAMNTLAMGSDSNLYVGGHFASIDGANLTNIARWDGTNWYNLGNGVFGQVFALAASGTNMLVGGSFNGPGNNFAEWTGSAWFPVCSNSVNSNVCAIAVLGADVYIGGDFTNSTTPLMPDVPLHYLAKQSGTNWIDVPGLNGPVFALTSISNQLYAGGFFTNVGPSSNVSYLARLDGTNWVGLGTGVDGPVRAFATCGSSLYVGGDFITAGGFSNANHIAKWNGTQWQTIANGVQGVPAPYNPTGTSDPTNTSVCGLSIYENSIFVGGVFTNANPALQNVPVSCVAQANWNEASQQWNWYALDFGIQSGVPNPSKAPNVLAALTRPDPTTNALDLFICGEFYYAGQTKLTNIYLARWSMGRSPSTNAPTVNITSPTNFTSLTDTGPITIQANATPAGASIAQVDFYVDGVDIGQTNSSPYATSWSPTAGLHTLLAKATDTAGNQGASAPVFVTVHSSTNTVTANNDFYTVVMNSPPATLNVLTNDTTTNSPSSLRIAQFSQSQNGLGVVSMSIDAKTLIYRPNPYAYGTDVFAYSATDGGSTNAAFVRVRILSPPYVQITTPSDGARTNVSSILPVTVQAIDFDGVITNVALYWNSTNLVGQATHPPCTFIWSNSSAGFFTFTAKGTDDTGLTTTSLPVTLALTNNTTSTNLPIAVISNLVDTVTLQFGIYTTNLPMIRSGFFDLQGRAASGTNAVEYQLVLYRPEDNDLAGAFTVPYANVTPGQDSRGFHAGGDTNGDLGNLDLTQIPNGTYDLQLVVRACGVQSTAAARFQLDTQLKIGQFSFSEQDLVIPVNGIPLTVVRTYNSLNPRSADFGYSWTYSMLGMDVQLDDTRTNITVGTSQVPWAYDEEDDGLPRVVSIRDGGGWDVTLTLPDGRRTTFMFNPTMTGLGASAQWLAPPDVHATLTALPGEDSIQYFPSLYWTVGGGDSTFINHDIKGWVLQTQDGTKYNITRGPLNLVTYWPDPSSQPINVNVYGLPQLTSIVQRTGDTINIGANGITHSPPNSTNVTRSVLFNRDSQGRIIAIWDPNSLSNSPASVYPALQYIYDADNGNLLQVLKLVDRTLGSYITNRYNYDNPAFPHYITSMVNPLGVPVARNYYDDSGRLTAVVDAYGNTNAFIHNLTNDIELAIDRLGFTNSYSYDTNGNVIAITNAIGGISQMTYDRNNNKTNQIDYLNDQPYATNNYIYDTNGFLLVSINPLGFSNVFTYNQYGQVLTSTRPCGCGYSAVNFYDANGDLTNTVDALGNGITNYYNSTGLLVGSCDQIGTLRTNFYDGSQNLVISATLSPAAVILSTNSFKYDVDGNRIASVVWRQVGGAWVGATNTYILDAQSRVTQIIDANGGTNTVLYDPAGRRQVTIDALYRTNSYGYDFLGRLVATTNADLTTTSAAYDARGNRTSSTDQLGRVTQYRYDPLGRRTNIIAPDFTQNLTFYDDLGRVIFSVDARGVTNAFGYDLAGRNVAVTNALGTTAQTYSLYGFDINGNPIYFTNALGIITTNIYDPLNRLTNVTFADGTAQTTVYDAAGRSIAKVDQANIVTTFAYDGFGRLTAVTNGLNKVTRYGYDQAGNKTNQVDALKRQTLFEYDALGRRTKRILPGLQTETFSYDAGGNCLSHSNFNGVVITNAYDNLNRLHARVYPDGTSNTFSYTLTGQRQTMSDASGIYLYIYDVRDRLCTNITPAGSLYYSYDANGNVTNISSSTPGGTLLGYQYDPLNRLTNVIDGRLIGRQNTTYMFNSLGSAYATQFPNGITNLYQYDSLDRLTNLVWMRSSSPLATFYYQLGSSGNRTNLNETVNGVNRNYAWQCDGLCRLTNEILSITAPTGTLGYVYDEVGNRIARNGNLGPIGSQTLTYDTNDWLTTDSYDNDGNTITNSAGRTYFYDYEDRLTNFNNGQLLIQYNGDGQRTKKTLNGTMTTLFLVDALNPSGYPQVIEELTINGGTTNLSSAYTYGLNLISQRQPGVGTNFFITDGHNSTRVLVDAATNVVNAFAYDGFGTLIFSNQAPQTSYLYCGEQFDSDLGLYYLRARYLCLTNGRFWTMDKIEGDGEDPLSLHKYLYAAADPIDYSDPTGNDLGSELASFAIWGIEIGFHEAFYGPGKDCMIKSPPTFSPTGPIKGRDWLQGGQIAAFYFSAEFVHDPEKGHCAWCCEARYMISWTPYATPDHPGFRPADAFESKKWYEDRNSEDKRIGHRIGPYAPSERQRNWSYTDSDGKTYDLFAGTKFNGEDAPYWNQKGIKGSWMFQIIIRDVCKQEDRAQSPILTVNWHK